MLARAPGTLTLGESYFVWENIAQRLEGRLVVLEPLEPRHEAGLWRAAAEPEIWRWMPLNASSSREDFHVWIEDALAQARSGVQAPFAILAASSGQEIGSSRYLTLRPEHRGLEIGFTWMARASWGTGANVEAKLLLLEHAFERLGCIRAEFKTDALNERSRGALAALPASFEGVFRKHMLVRGGELRDSAYYSVVDDDWPDVKAALRARVAALF
jgi:N-acetyltransferase